MSENGVPADRRQRLVHRLVGAAVLVALAVILIPLLLELRGEDGTAITRSNIPDKPDGFRVEEITLNRDIRAPEVATGSAAESGRAAGSDKPGPESTAAGPAPAPEPNPNPEPNSGLQGWAVQIGSFSSEENAASLRDQLRDHGFSAFLDEVTVDSSRMFRVLVGPDARRESSEKLRDRLAGELKLDGVVVGYQ